MLSDAVASARREINLINLALTEGVPARLRAVAGAPLRLRTEMTTCARTPAPDHALHPDAAACQLPP